MTIKIGPSPLLLMYIRAPRWSQFPLGPCSVLFRRGDRVGAARRGSALFSAWNPGHIRASGLVPSWLP
jgi:hypothetical protein